MTLCTHISMAIVCKIHTLFLNGRIGRLSTLRSMNTHTHTHTVHSPGCRVIHIVQVTRIK